MWRGSLLPFCFFAFLPFCFFAFLPICLSAFLPICLSAFLPFCLFAFLPFCLSAFLPFCLFAYLPICLFAFLPFCLFPFFPFSLFAFLPFRRSRRSPEHVLLDGRGRAAGVIQTPHLARCHAAVGQPTARSARPQRHVRHRARNDSMTGGSGHLHRMSAAKLAGAQSSILAEVFCRITCSAHSTNCTSPHPPNLTPHANISAAQVAFCRAPSQFCRFRGARRLWRDRGKEGRPTASPPPPAALH